MTTQTERRRHPRLALTGRRVIVSDASPDERRLAGELRDLSARGIRCAVPLAAPGAEGRDVVIELALPSAWWRRVLRLPARLIRSGPEPATYAFEITAAPDSREARGLEAFLGRAATASRQLVIERPGLDRQIEEALRMVQLGLPPHEEARPRVVMLTAPTPGKTGFLSAGLAVVLASQGDPVLAVDFDLANPSLQRLLGVGPSPGVADWLGGAAADRRPVDLLQLGTGGVRVLPAGLSDSRRTSCGRTAIASLVDALRSADARYVVINAPACLAAADAGLLSEVADDVVLVLRSSTSSAAEVVEASALLARHGAHLRGVILMDAEPATSWFNRLSAFRLGARWRSLRRGRSRIAGEPGARSITARPVEFTSAVPGGELGADEGR